ncbi:MAG TPA: hypothetical protein P5196_11620 [Syntrophales bacterium]|jgi:CRISPR-associated protein Csx14|nr:hypothetical protein [Candidatus Hydrogenedentota bacterium]HQF85462.1 hypothetical protein [Smithellaceae bacterium]HRR48225.1 hypothetical protein [Syntrophales bacterium]
MINPRLKATISIPVDLYNPGQVLACCGLLELSNRLTATGSHALGWFEEDTYAHSWFLVAGLEGNDEPITLEKIINKLKSCEINTVNADAKEGPVFLGIPFSMTIDWRTPFPQNGLIKTFAGNQNLFQIVQALIGALPDSFDDKLLSAAGSVDREVTAFGVEKAENAIDAGFSMDNHKNHLFRHPPVFLELLALIGAQRFCPGQIQDRLSRSYFVWHHPLPVPLAAVAISKPLVPVFQKGFIFQMYKRDPQGRYKGFTPAREITQRKGEK